MGSGAPRAGYKEGVQTFLPYPDFAATASVLDDRRLGKQRVEGLQIVKAIVVAGYPWRHHPAALMWAGHEDALECYLTAVCDEWQRRGFADTCRASIRAHLDTAGVAPPVPQAVLAAGDRLPPWLGDETLHRSHRGSLLLKDPEWYGRFFPPVEAEGWDGYVWPVRAERPLVGATRRRSAA